jgi:hypothetical protein
MTRRWRPWALALVLCATAWLAACRSAPTAAPVASAEAPAAPAPAPRANAPAPPPLVDATAPTVNASHATPDGAGARTDDDPVDWALSYAERLRQMPPAEVVAEIANIGEPGGSARRQMQLALALMHAPPPGDTARALGLFQRVISHPSEDATPYKPLARLLVTTLAVQRRLEESNERLHQQWREAQRRIETLSEQLNAMRAIERSLSPRPAPSSSR